VVRFRLAEVLEDRGWTAYRLAREVEDAGGDLTMRAAYRLARPGAAVRRLDLDVLDVLCRVLETTPGDLLEYTPAKAKRGRG
jgi:DNA-binding Xre family transcriptional regulator